MTSDTADTEGGTETTTVDEFEHAGRQCRVLRIRSIGGGWYCGYVRTDLPASTAADELQDALDVHGGLTYGVDEEGWIGFDCAHAGDVCLDVDGDPLTGYDGKFGLRSPAERSDGLPTRRWTPEDVIEETKRVAEQVRALESGRES
jgi:hypothetical protein